MAPALPGLPLARGRPAAILRGLRLGVAGRAARHLRDVLGDRGVSASRWKRAERDVARSLGTERLPNIGAGQPDCRAEGFAYQIKTTKALPRWLKDAVEQATRDAGDDERPVVVLNEVRPGVKAYRLVVVPWELWPAVMRSERGVSESGGV